MSPVAGGLNSQLGVAEETTVGTAVTVDRFYEFGSESLKQNIERIEHQGLRPTRRVLGANNRVAGRVGVDGSLEMAVMNKGFGLLFEYALGAVATSQPDAVNSPLVYSHKCTVGAIDAKGLTVQVGRTDVGGTTRAFTYAGCKIAEWELSWDTQSQLMLSLSLDGMSETTATALAAASYPAGIVPFPYTQGVISLAGSAYDVSEFSLSGNNGLATDRYFIRGNGATKKEQLEGAGTREYTGSLTADFTDLTAYNRFVSGETAAITLAATGAVIEDALSYSVTVSLPCVQFDGETPNVGGPEILSQSLPFKVLDNSDVDGPVVVTVQTTDATP